MNASALEVEKCKKHCDGIFLSLRLSPNAIRDE